MECQIIIITKKKNPYEIKRSTWWCNKLSHHHTLINFQVSRVSRSKKREAFKFVYTANSWGGIYRKQKFYDKLDGATRKKSTNHKLPCITLTLVDLLGRN